MGNNTSQEDRVPLLNDDSEGVDPIFEELKIVLIGSHNAGKNAVGNAVVGRKVFRFWSKFNRRSIDKTCKVSGRRIYLSRVPGWKGELSQSADIKEELVSCIRSSRPHAVLLVINVKSTLTELTIRTLENNLSSQLWEHTILVFTNTRRRECENNNTLMPHEHLIDKCGRRYVIQSDCDQITEKIEEIVACKNASLSFFKLNVSQGPDNIERLANLDYVVNRIKNRIQFLLTSRERRRSRGDLNEEQLALKDAEIERLKQSVNDKESEIERLKSTIQRPLQEENNTLQQDNYTLNERITTLQKEYYTLQKEYNTLQKEYNTLQHENSALEKRMTTLQDENKLQKGENKTLKKEITKLHQRMTTLQDENKKLQEEMTKLQMENERLQKEMITLQEENKTVQKTAKLQEENKNLDENIKTLERKIINLQDKIITQQDKITKLHKDSETMNVKNKTLLKDIATLHCDNTTLQKKNKTLQEEMTSLKQTHKEHSGFKSNIFKKLKKKLPMTTSNETELQVFSSRDGEHNTWPLTLIKILDEMSEDHLKKMKYLMECKWNIAKGLLEGKDKYKLAVLVRETWDENQSIRKMQEIIKEIPRMDLLPFIEPLLKDHE